MTRLAAPLMAVLVVVAYYAMGRVTWVAVHGVDPWPWVRAGLGAACVVVGALVVLIEMREDRAR